MSFKLFSQLLSDWRKATDQVEAVANNLPRIIGVESVRVIKENFKLEGYDDGISFTPWEPRKEETNARYDKRTGVKGASFNSSNKIMNQTENLRDANHYTVNGRQVVVGVDLNVIPYGQIHNEGLQGKAWGKHTFKMPKRQYIPVGKPNVKILKAVRKKLTFEIGKAMKEFKK